MFIVTRLRAEDILESADEGRRITSRRFPAGTSGLQILEITCADRAEAEKRFRAGRRKWEFQLCVNKHYLHIQMAE
jgi:hypothetical protein